MKKRLIIGSTAAVLTLGLVGAALAQGGGHGRAGGPGMGGAMQLFERFDRSGEGRVSQEDVDAVRAERFAAFDANGDGVLDLEEYEQLWLDAMRRQMVRGFQRLDVDGDAGVTAEEFGAPFGRLVERLDRDGDGVVTRDELRETMRERHRGRGEGPRGERRAQHRSAD